MRFNLKTREGKIASLLEMAQVRGLMAGAHTYDGQEWDPDGTGPHWIDAGAFDHECKELDINPLDIESDWVDEYDKQARLASTLLDFEKRVVIDYLHSVGVF